MSESPFPFRRPDQPWGAYVQAVGRWIASPGERAAALVRAVGSGHGDDWRDLGDDGAPARWWSDEFDDSERVARRLRALICWRLASTPAPEPPAETGDLGEALLAAINTMSAPMLFDAAAALRGSDPRGALARLRERGEAVLCERPDLSAVMPGPPVAIALDSDRPERELTEVERVAPGVAPGPALIHSLAEAALRGDLNAALLPHHLLVAVRAELLAQAREMGFEARLPAALDPDADPEALLSDLLGSPEFQAAAAGLRAALDGVALVMAPTGGYRNGG